MANLERFRQMTEAFSEVADFTTIYLAEAHPTDGWAISGNVEVAKHKNLEDRMTAARKMVELQAVGSPILVDPLSDETARAYSGIPERLYIIQDGIIVYKGGQGPFGYKLDEVEDWLKKYKGE